MSKRDRILRATSDIIRNEGLTALTTKKVAKAAGCAEGTIFNQFGDKGGLVAAVLASALPETQALYAAADEARNTDLKTGLVAVIASLLDWYRASYPLLASALAERAVFDQYVAAHRNRGTGPHQPWILVRQLIQRHVDERGFTADLDVDMLALQVVGACQNAAWVELVNGRDPIAVSSRDFAERLAKAIIRQIPPT